jgi:hypothetical protein
MTLVRFPGPGVTDPDQRVRTFHPVLKQLDGGKVYDLPEEKAQLYLAAGLFELAPPDPPSPAPSPRKAEKVAQPAKEDIEKAS